METTWRGGRYLWRVSPVSGLLLGLVVLALLIWWRPSARPTAVPVAQLATARLSTNGSDAMFAVDRLVPDQPVFRCIDVRYDGTAAIGSVTVAAVDVTGALAPYLGIRVERSRDGASVDCAGFAADVTFAGTLRELADVGLLGVDSGWAPEPASSRTFRITVILASDAPQGQTSTATFRWVLTQNLPLQTPPAVLPSVAVTTPARRVPSSAPSSVPASDGASASWPVEPSASSGATSTPTVGSGKQRGSGGGTGDGVAEQIAVLLDTVGDAARAAIKLAAQHGRFPTLPVVLLAAFVTVQNRIDRRDPKLLAAPLWRDNYVTFPND
jgi:hypothetical protein